MPKTKAGYVDGFVFVVPKKNLKAYLKMAQEGRELWMKYGALDYVECISEDLKTHKGALSFKDLVKPKPTEVVGFSYIVYKSRKHRDEVNKKVMKDPYMQSSDPDHMKKMPFDPSRMAYGGFAIKVSV